MKKLNVLTRMLLLVALLAGSTSSVWGDTVTFTAGTDKSEGTSINKGGITVSFSDGVFNRDDNYRCYSGASMTISSSVGNMTSIAFVATDGNPMTKFSGNPDVGSWTKTSDTNWTWNGEASEINFGSTSGQCRITSILVTYTPAQKEDPTITFNNGSIRVGKTLDLSTLFTSNSLGAVTYTVTSGDTYASVEGNILTGLAEGSVTVKAAQASYGIYNAGEKSATITVNPALVLSSIAVTTAPTKTTYTEGETFDPTGMVVTATYADESTDDVTTACTFTPSGALTTSVNEITISYTENAVNKTTTQAITVNEVVDYVTLPFKWAGGVNADLRAIVGVTTNVDESNYAESNAPYRIKFNGTGKYITFKTNEQPGIVTIGIKKVGGKKNSTIKIEESSNGTVFTEVQSFQTEGESSNTIFNFKTTNNFNDNTRYVRIYFKKDGDNVGVGPITISEASVTVTIGTSGFASYCSTNALDFTDSDVNAYAAKVSGTNVVLTKVDKVPANEGVVLYCETSGNYDIPVIATADDVENNEMVGVTERTQINWNAGGKYNYILQSGQFNKANGGYLKANRAYLSTTYEVAEGKELSIIFNDDIEDENETNGIRSIKGDETSSLRYNLAGQKVSKDYKGIVIINGKKMLNK